MSIYNELPVCKATYDLLLEMFRFTNDFSKEYKYTVGESLKNETIELITLIYRANSRPDKQSVLQIARENISGWWWNYFCIAGYKKVVLKVRKVKSRKYKKSTGVNKTRHGENKIEDKRVAQPPTVKVCNCKVDTMVYI